MNAEIELTRKNMMKMMNAMRSMMRGKFKLWRTS